VAGVTVPLDSFRLLVAADDALQTALAGTDDFAGTALAIAALHGLALEAADLAPLLAPDPLGLVALDPPPLLRRGWPPPGWLPYRVSPDGVDWADFGGIALGSGFYTGAVGAALARPLNRLLRCRTGFDDFLRGPPEGLRLPDGLVFHMSRCGSTLVARMLAALPDSYAINEAGPVDALLNGSRGAPDQWRIAALRALVGALGRRPSRRWFLKLAAWPALDLPLFRCAFPDVPWVFLHREPTAVLASQMAARAPELDPLITPPAALGLAPDTAQSGEDYCAMALARICEAALAADGGLYVDHEELPDAVFSFILPHFGIAGEEGVAHALHELPRWHAKHPGRPYRPETTVPDPAISAAVDAHLAAIHARLGAVRG
jgi:hypothetical protein